MKYLIASDIHGSAYYMDRLLEEVARHQPERLILLGDFLYHGPRNDLPREYDPKRVLAALNGIKEKIYAVRGNCDSEVDQMVLEFPMMADYALMELFGVRFYVTHGHLHSPENLPPMQAGEVFLFGHIHLPVAKKEGDIFILNPGSISIPKGGNPSSYGILEEGVFSVLDLAGNRIGEIQLDK